MGRPRKPAAELKLHGTFRPDRHGPREPEQCDATPPEKPGGLSPAAAAFWDDNVPRLIARKVVTASDGATLHGMCELWGLFASTLEAAKKDPIDKPTRTALTSYWAAFASMAARFGLNPSDRLRLRVNAEGKATNEKAKFFKQA